MVIKVEEIEDIVRKALFSAYLKDEQPLSLLIVAKPESGKTTILKRFYKNNGVLVLSDTTAYGIIQETDKLRDIESGKVRHIVIPDLIAPLSKKWETNKSFIAFMSALIEEGIVNMRSYAVNLEDRKIPVKCGLITTVTSEYLEDQRHGWLKMGFLSRMLPISYAYSGATQDEIFGYIAKQLHLNGNDEELDLPLRNVKVELNENYAMVLIDKVKEMAEEAEGIYGFRLQRQLQTLLKASALEAGREQVEPEDLKTIMDMLQYVNLDYKEI